MKNRRFTQGFTLIECMIALAITSVAFLGTLSLLGFSRVQNEIAQERARAHQMVTEALDIELYRLFSWTQSQSQRTMWDNGTPEDTSDDTVGSLSIVVKNPATGETLTMAPDPAVLVSIEVTMTWTLRGRPNKTLRETVMTFKVP